MAVAEEFDTIISLGSRCQVAYQLRRIFPSLQSQFFDWLITPDHAIVEILTNGVEPFPEETVLSLGPSHRDEFNFKHIVDERFGVLMSHDFQNDGTHFRDQWPLIAGKYRKTSSRFHETLCSSKRTLFVRASFGASGSFGYDAADRASHSLGLDIEKAITQMYPHLQFDLMLISHVESDRIHDGRVRVVHLPEQKNWNWQGVDSQWDEIFRNIHLSSLIA